MPGLMYKFDDCLNRAEFSDDVEVNEAIDRILSREAHVELMTEYPIYKTRLKSDGIEKTQPRLLFCALPTEGKSFFVVLGIVANHDYHRSKFLQPKVLDHYLKQNINRFLNEARLLIQNEADNTRLMHDLDQKIWNPVSYHHQACYYDEQFVIPSGPQLEALLLPSPAVFSGPAGSGKSYVLFEKLRELLACIHPDEDGNIIYVAKSAELVGDLQTMWGLFSTSVANHHRVIFTSYDQMIMTLDPVCLEENKACESDWFTWFHLYLNQLERAANTGRILQPWVKKFRDDPDAVFEEFRIISLYATTDGPFTQNSYIHELGRRQSLFPSTRDLGPRHILLKAYIEYQLHLKQSGRWDPAFHPLPSHKPVFAATMVDEALDLSLLQLGLLFQLTHNARIYYAVDSHQRLRDRISFRPALLSLLRVLAGRSFHAHLPGSYRCANKIIELTNTLIQAKIVVTGGIADEHEIRQISLSDDPEQEWGDVFLLRPKNNEDLILRDMFPSELWAVVTSEEYVDEARARYGTSLVFTPEQIKGLGYKYIIVYKLFNDSKKLWKSASSALGPETSSMKAAVGRTVDGIGDPRFAPLFNIAITSITRAVDSVFIVNDTPHELRHITQRIKKHAAPIESLPACLSRIRAVDTFDKDAMREHAGYLLKNHQELQAKRFCLQELSMSLEEFTAFKREHTFAHAEISPMTIIDAQILYAPKKNDTIPTVIAEMSAESKPSRTKGRKKNKPLIPHRDTPLPNDHALLPRTAFDYSELSINALLADFTCDNLTRWFSDKRGIPALASTIKQDNGKVTSLCEVILTNPILTDTFCNYLMQSERTSNDQLINRLANEVIVSSGAHMAHLAAFYNCIPMLDLLEAYSVNLERGDEHCRSPLFFAIWGSGEYHALESIERLVIAGAQFSNIYDQGFLLHGVSMAPFFVAIDYTHYDPTCVTGRALLFSKASPFMIAAAQGDLKKLQFILRETDIDINSTLEPTGATALLIAIQHGHTDVVNALIRAGAHVNKPLYNGATPLILASQFGYLDIVKSLLAAGASVNAWTEYGSTALISAVNFGRSTIVETLLDADANLFHKQFNSGYSASIIANKQLNPSIMDLIEKDATRGEQISTLLTHLTVDNLINVCFNSSGTQLLRHLNFESESKTPIDCVLMSILSSPEKTKFFCDFLQFNELGKIIALRLSSERRGHDGATAMHMAAGFGCVRLINVFIELKLNIDMPNHFGERPLSEAVRWRRADATTALIRGGADVAGESKGRFNPSQVFPSPLYIAIEADREQSHFAVILSLIIAGAVPYLKEAIFHPLLIATRLDNKAYIKILLQRGAPVDHRDIYGMTSLYIASDQGHESVVTLLLNHNADVNLALPNGMTPLMIAAKNGYANVVLILLKFGADVSKVTTEQQDVFSVAQTAEQGGILELLSTFMNEKRLASSQSTSKSPLVALSCFSRSLNFVSECTTEHEVVTKLAVDGR